MLRSMCPVVSCPRLPLLWVWWEVHHPALIPSLHLCPMNTVRCPSACLCVDEEAMWLSQNPSQSGKHNTKCKHMCVSAVCALLSLRLRVCVCFCMYVFVCVFLCLCLHVCMCLCLYVSACMCVEEEAMWLSQKPVCQSAAREGWGGGEGGSRCWWKPKISCRH